MNAVEHIAGVRAAVAAARSTGRRIAFVPTMGALHAGHLSLVKEAGTGGAFVVMSIFVNPLQFGPSEDFTRYPRDPERDSALARDAGVDLLFMPTTEEMYGQGAAAVVTPRIASDAWEGEVRPGHFEGVLTVVAKLFNIVQPDVAVFGQKDIQQATLIAGMIRSLDFPIELVVAPTVREQDGLALSSRNAYLSTENRTQALAISRALRAVDSAWRAGEQDTGMLERAARTVLTGAGIEPDYFAIVEPRGLAPTPNAEPGSIVLTAARVGPTRLIDNIILGERAVASSTPALRTGSTDAVRSTR